MRILIGNDGALDAGGVTTYLETVGSGLRSRGHEVGYLYCNTAQTGDAVARFAEVQFNTETSGVTSALNAVVEWRPQVVYSHNMRPLNVERDLLDRFPVVKFMHGYFGTCVSGLKLKSFPTVQPCNRCFGPACLALYLPRRCGQLSLKKMAQQYRWAAEQKQLFGRYRAVVVASEHMGNEYIRNGVPRERLLVNPLFAPSNPLVVETAAATKNDGEYRLLFLGRMTKLKGGDILIRAIAKAKQFVSKPISVVLAGDGPQRSRWEQSAKRLGVNAEFPGWLDEASRTEELRRSDLLVVPSVWPEPFGLVGLEAAQQGVPAVAFDVGGVREWLVPEVTGWLATGSSPTARGLSEALVNALSDSQELFRRGQAAAMRSEEMSLAAHLRRLECLFRVVFDEATMTEARTST